MSINDYYCGTVIAMTGDGCFGIASDKRLGVRHATIDTNFTKVYQMDDNMFVGLPGIPTDAITFSQKLKFRMNMFALREGRKMTANMFLSVVSNMMYEKRFGPYYVAPVAAALDIKTNQPIVAAYDCIGAGEHSNSFVASGTGNEQAIGLCEQYWQPGLKPDQLFETLSQCMMGALERDASSGWGVVLHIVEKDKITTTELKTRMD